MTPAGRKAFRVFKDATRCFSRALVKIEMPHGDSASLYPRFSILGSRGAARGWERNFATSSE
jgi:hypothetical protein